MFFNENNKVVKWSVFDAVMVLVILLGLLFAVRSFAPQIRSFFEGIQLFGLNTELKLFFFSSLIQSLMILLIVGVFFRFRRVGLKDLGLSFENIIQNLYTGIGGGILLFFLVVTLGAVIVYFTNNTPPPQEVATYLVKMEGKWGRILALFLGSVMAPLSEELYFRGMVFSAVKHKWGRMTGIIVSGIFFSVMHMDLIRFIPIAVGGMGLAYLYDKTKSLWTSIIAHATWNGIMMSLMVTASKYA